MEDERHRPHEPEGDTSGMIYAEDDRAMEAEERRDEDEAEQAVRD